jgi:hypothetical protein
MAEKYLWNYTGRTQKNGAVSKEFTVDTAPFFCVCPVIGNFFKLRNHQGENANTVYSE